MPSIVFRLKNGPLNATANWRLKTGPSVRVPAFPIELDHAQKEVDSLGCLAMI
jgi:hypothetical protein